MNLLFNIVHIYHLNEQCQSINKKSHIQSLHLNRQII